MRPAPPPRYGLYGERQQWTRPEPLHCETIRARSVLHDWHFAPHSHADLFQLVGVEHGTAQVWLESGPCVAEGPAVVFVPPAHVHGFAFTPGTVGEVLTAPEFVLQDLLGEAPELRAVWSAPRVVRLAATGEPARLVVLLREVQAEYEDPRPGRLAALMAMTRHALVELARHVELSPEAPDVERARTLLARFRGLVARHYREGWPVSRYARELGISLATLKRVCAAQADSSAQQLIHRCVAIEAGRLLAFSDFPVTRIALYLGFRDPAYFARFFQRECGLSPSAYRRQHQADAATAPARPAATP